MNGISLPVIHPQFENLRKKGRLLHLVAATLIVVHAVSHFNQPGVPIVYFACLLLIALDIFILVFATRSSLSSMPKVNLFFRAIECVFFLGIGVEMLVKEYWLSGASHLVLGIAYSYLFYCERKLHTGEVLGIYHTGLSIPSLPDSKFLLWSSVSNLEASYSSIRVDIGEKTIEFDLQQNLQFGELDQIHEFCRHYLGKPI